MFLCGATGVVFRPPDSLSLSLSPSLSPTSGIPSRPRRRRDAAIPPPPPPQELGRPGRKLYRIIQSVLPTSYLCVCLWVRLSLGLSVCPSVPLSLLYLAFCLSVSWSVRLGLSGYICVSLSLHLSFCLSQCISLSSYISLSVHISLYIFQSVCLSFCVSLSIICLSSYKSIRRGCKHQHLHLWYPGIRLVVTQRVVKVQHLVYSETQGKQTSTLEEVHEASAESR